MKIPSKTELQQIALNHSSDIDLKDFIKICKKMYCRIIFFLVNDTTLPSDNPLRFRKNLLNKYIIKPWQLIYPFLVNDTTLPSENPLRLRKTLLNKCIIKP